MFGRESRLSKGTPRSAKKTIGRIESSHAMSKEISQSSAEPSAANTVSLVLQTHETA